MEVLAVVRTKREEEFVDKVYSMEGLDEVLGKSDFVVNALPGTEETKHLYNMDKFKKFKIGAYFINIGRGNSVRQEDLIQALNDGTLAGAGLDVFENEPLQKDSPLWDMENVIITPHYSGWTPFYMDRVIEIFCQNLEAYLKDDELPNLVNKNLGY